MEVPHQPRRRHGNRSDQCSAPRSTQPQMLLSAVQDITPSLACDGSRRTVQGDISNCGVSRLLGRLLSDYAEAGSRSRRSSRDFGSYTSLDPPRPTHVGLPCPGQACTLTSPGIGPVTFSVTPIFALGVGRARRQLATRWLQDSKGVVSIMGFLFKASARVSSR